MRFLPKPVEEKKQHCSCFHVLEETCRSCSWSLCPSALLQTSVLMQDNVKIKWKVPGWKTLQKNHYGHFEGPRRPSAGPSEREMKLSEPKRSSRLIVCFCLFPFCCCCCCCTIKNAKMVKKKKSICITTSRIHKCFCRSVWNFSSQVFWCHFVWIVSFATFCLFCCHSFVVIMSLLVFALWHFATTWYRL